MHERSFIDGARISVYQRLQSRMQGNGQQEWWYCLIIQIGYDYHEQESLGAEAELAGHCDHKEEESDFSPPRSAPPFL